MEITSSVTTVPLKKLSLSPANVRKTNGEEDIEGLAADIDERGLDQNLVVTSFGKPGYYEVVAGDRRYRALRKLQGARKIPADFAVPVKIIPPVDGRAASLAENVQRVAMNPADEIEAFAAIVAEHSGEPDPLAYCARRTGRSRDVVEQRLRLAKLPVEILGALRVGTIGLSAATAYAAVADPALQLQTFRSEEARAYGEKHRPTSIRDTLKMRTLPASCSQLRYVGMAAYLAAGGRVDRDLFMGADVGEQLLDPSLLDRLVREKAEAQVTMLAESDGFASGVLTKTLNALPIWPATPPGYRIGCQIVDENFVTKPSFAVRETAIGVYGLCLGALNVRGWFEPVPAASVSARQPAPPEPKRDDGDRSDPTPAPVREPVLSAPNFRPGDTLRDQALRLTAARIVVEHVSHEDLEQRMVWPDGPGFLPPVTTAIGDDDMILVAVQIRVPRAELEAAMPEAVAQLETDDQANDHVAASQAEAA